MPASFIRFFLHLLGLLCTLWLWKGFVFGQSPEEVISVELVSTQSMIKAGTQGWLGLKVKLAPDWHIVEKFRESGYPTTVAWDALSGVAIDPLEYPLHTSTLTMVEVATFQKMNFVCLLFRVSPTIPFKKDEIQR